MRTIDLIRIVVKNNNYGSKETFIPKLDVFLMANRITTDEYQEALRLLDEKEEEKRKAKELLNPLPPYQS